MQAFDEVITTKNEDLLNNVGDIGLKFLTEGNAEDNLDQFLDQQEESGSSNFENYYPLAKFLWAYQNRGSNYEQKYVPEKEITNVIDQRLIEENPKLEKLIGAIAQAQETVLD